jgi:Novel toxin 15
MQAANSAATGKDALHKLDMVAGGAPRVFSGLGGQSENRSIGSQWSKGKANQLAAYASEQCKNGCPLMQTRLVAV